MVLFLWPSPRGILQGHYHNNITQMTDILGNLFGTFEKVKIMRLFLLNPDTTFDAQSIAAKSQVSVACAKREIELIKKTDLIKKKTLVRIIAKKKGKKKTEKKVKSQGYTLNPTFPYLEPLRGFLIDISPVQGLEVFKRISKIGKLKLLILSGIFIRDWDSRIDMLVVGDNLKKGVLDRTIKALESEIGKEIRYSAFETPDFQYRLGMYDKLVRDVFDYPHEVIVDKLGVGK